MKHGYLPVATASYEIRGLNRCGSVLRVGDTAVRCQLPELPLKSHVRHQGNHEDYAVTWDDFGDWSGRPRLWRRRESPYSLPASVEWFVREGTDL